MRALLFIIITLIVPHFVQAQSDFAKGTFRLKKIPEIQMSGLLRSGSSLDVKQTPDGPSVKYPWEDILSYKTGIYRYIRASGFTMRNLSGWSHEIADNRFVLLLDSGAVSLMRYEYDFALYNTNQPPPSIILLQRANEKEATDIPYSVFEGGGKKFRESLKPYVTERPDLLALLADKKNHDLQSANLYSCLE
ncbi:hypothetical protein [Hymenobacter sp. B1770]|uniref:hypothetical protein n=1 Tax=Hymenobacter sp. B1770 TaxID=1718788 RepID=UPI003CF96D89